MLKKIITLFIFISTFFILPVYADRQFQFELKKDIENQQITYTWENKLEDISFEMVSPSKKVYNENTYDLIDYNLEHNKVVICFEKMEKGIWKVFFRGDVDPVGVKSSVIEYFPTSVEDEKIDKSEKETNEVVSSESSETPGIIIIGGEQEKTEEIENEKLEEVKVEEIEKIENVEEEVIEEENKEPEIVLTEEELKLIEEKENLAKERLEERNLAKESKKQQKAEEQLALEEAKKEEELKESEEEIVFMESQPIEEEVIEENEKADKVIILGNEEDTSIKTVEIQESEREVNLVNINADEERAKIQQQIEKENTKILINRIIMVLPLITVIILFIANLFLKKKIKEQKAMMRN